MAKTVKVEDSKIEKKVSSEEGTSKDISINESSDNKSEEVISAEKSDKKDETISLEQINKQAEELNLLRAELEKSRAELNKSAAEFAQLNKNMKTIAEEHTNELNALKNRLPKIEEDKMVAVEGYFNYDLYANKLSSAQAKTDYERAQQDFKLVSNFFR